MTRVMLRRLAILEAKLGLPAPEQEPERPQVDGDALLAMLNKHIAESQAPEPTGAEGAHRWRAELAENLATAAMPIPPAPERIVLGDFTHMRILAARHEVPACRWKLRGRELDVLAAQGFDAVRIQTWRIEHEGYSGIPWQWRAEELPAEAMAVVDAALRFDKPAAGMTLQH